MRILLVIAVLLASTAAAQAQPGQTEPVGYYGPVQLQLTEEQQDLLAQGEISIGRYITGGVMSYAVGFGVGHMIQGRWNEQGWIFTVGEAAALTALVYGLAQSNEFDQPPHAYEYEQNHSNRRGRSYILGGIAALVGFRVWEVVDAWVAPPAHNRKVRALKQQLGLAPPTYGFYLAPPHSPDASGGVAGLSLRF